MKTKEEILFEKMQPGESGGIEPLTDKQILESMQEYADEYCREFLDWYLKRKGSKFEIAQVVETFKIYQLDNEIF